MTFAAVAVMAVALSLAVVPALFTSQVFAQPECPGCHGGGHTEGETECKNTSSDSTSEGECPGNSLKSPNKQEETEVKAGKSGQTKGTKIKTDP